jgi:hypothetical protein
MSNIYIISSIINTEQNIFFIDMILSTRNTEKIFLGEAALWGFHELYLILAR